MYERHEKLTGTKLRAAAVSEGLPPIVALATQISTRITGNMVAYRGSGPIPPGLYHSIFTGEGRPKPVTEKAKSSTIGPQAGRAVADQRNGRYDLNKDTGKYELRLDTPPKGLDPHPLEMSLRNIFNDIGTKYALVGESNPDKDGILRFSQIDHHSDEVKKIIYSVNVKDAKPIPKEIIDNYKLVSDQFQHLGKEPGNESPFHGLNLDALCPVSAKHPGDQEPKVIQVLGGIVRDCDIDFMTDPSKDSLKKMLGEGDLECFLTPLDMSAHLHSPEIKLEDDKEKIRANKAVKSMVVMLLDINDRKWEQYNAIKKDAISKGGPQFDSKKWENEHADIKPFVAENIDSEVMSAVVVTVGKGTPMQLYQALEINVIEQKILASCTSKDGTRVNIEDLDSENDQIKNAALMKIHDQSIEYSKETIAKSFIQHPAECHNEHYTSPRCVSVGVIGDNIIMADDKDMTKILDKIDQYIPINPKWISDNSPGNQNAEAWVTHFIFNSDTHYKNEPDIIKVIDAYLERPKNIDFIFKLQEDINAHPNKKGTDIAKKYLNVFLENNKEVKSSLDRHAIKKRGIPDDTNVNESLINKRVKL